MLESMILSPNPTRAEAADIANAIYDGTDAVMLSGETAIGLYPKNAVDFMRNVAQEVEADLDYDRILQEKSGFVEEQTDDAISYSASRIANRLSADVIVAFTESGSTARRVSKYRPGPPILALTPYESVKRVLTISWGVTPAIGPGLQNVDEILIEAETQAVSSGWLARDGKLVLTAGFPFGVAGSTNFLHVMDLATRSAGQSVKERPAGSSTR
jgi:pyruvate kinase